MYPFVSPRGRTCAVSPLDYGVTCAGSSLFIQDEIVPFHFSLGVITCAVSPLFVGYALAVVCFFVSRRGRTRAVSPVVVFDILVNVSRFVFRR